MRVVYDSTMVIIDDVYVYNIYILARYSCTNSMHRAALMCAAPPDHLHTSTIVAHKAAIADLYCAYTDNDPNIETQGQNHK